MTSVVTYRSRLVTGPGGVHGDASRLTCHV